jgi:arylsulfatase A-like enzyme
MRNTVLWLIVCGVLAASALGCSRPSPDSVFLIVVDTLRPDRLSCYARVFYTTPHIDSLAAEGVRFTQAQSAASWAIPSVGAMMTSLYPTQLGLVEKPAGEGERFEWRQPRDQRAYTLAPEERTLAEIMGDAGFTTAAFVNQPALNANNGFTQGFDDYYYPIDSASIGRFDPSGMRDSRDGSTLFEDARAIDGLLVDGFDAWLDRNCDRRVFVWIHLLTPHHPYNPPPWTERRTMASPESDAYDGEVIAADEIVGRIVGLIDNRVGADRSVVILASDNGEEFGEREMKEHGHSLHGEVTWIPLIIRAPQAPAGRTVKSIVRTIDILPTVLELSGTSSRLPEDARGESLVPLFETNGAHRTVYAEAVLYGGTKRMLMAGGKKLLYDENNDRHALFDYLYDPGETIDLVEPRADLADSLRTALEAMYAELLDDYSKRSGGRGASGEGAERFKRAMVSAGE